MDALHRDDSARESNTVKRSGSECRGDSERQCVGKEGEERGSMLFR